VILRNDGTYQHGVAFWSTNQHR